MEGKVGNQFPLDLVTTFHKTTKLGILEQYFAILDSLEVVIG
jgi:hypothetical protein